jgi:hypothetical protein
MIELDQAGARPGKVDLPQRVRRGSQRNQSSIRGERKGAESDIPLFFSLQADFMLRHLETVRVYPP